MEVKLNIALGETIMPVDGNLANAITAEKLKNEPEKYVHLYPHLYANAAEIKRRLSIGNGKVIHKAEGVSVITSANGDRVFSRTNKTESQKKLDLAAQQKAYVEMLAKKGLVKEKQPAKRSRRSTKK